MITENLSTLNIHKLTQEQYDRELEAGRVDPSAIYLTPDDGDNSNIYIQNEEPIDAEEGSLWVDMDAVGTVGGSYSAEIPTFNLTEMGLPAVNYGSGETVLVDTNAQALLEALLDGPVKIKYQFYGDATSGQVVDSEVVVCANTISGYGVAQATFVTDTNGFFVNSLVVSSERITLCSTFASKGSFVPSGGTASQVLTMGSDGSPVWANAPSGGNGGNLLVNFTMSNGVTTASCTTAEVISAIENGYNVFGILNTGTGTDTFLIPSSSLIIQQAGCVFFIGVDISTSKMFYLAMTDVDGVASVSIQAINNTLPPGGTTGQYLRKKSNGNGDVEWVTLSESSSIPTPTESDYGKVLSATAEGLKWVTPSGGSGNVSSAEGVGF